MSTESDFIHALVDVVPELRPQLQQHLSDEEGELLPYVFLGDVAAWLHEQSQPDPQRVSELFAWLEERFDGGDFDTRNLIDVGLVEMLPAHPDGATVLSLLGPQLRARAEVAGLLPTDEP